MRVGAWAGASAPRAMGLVSGVIASRYGRAMAVPKPRRIVRRERRRLMAYSSSLWLWNHSCLQKRIATDNFDHQARETELILLQGSGYFLNRTLVGVFYPAAEGIGEQF